MAKDDLKKYHQRVSQVGGEAVGFKNMFVHPIMDGLNDKGKPNYLGPGEDRRSALKTAIQGTFLEDLGDDALNIAETAANSFVNYTQVHDSAQPDDEVLASAMGTLKAMTGHLVGDEGNKSKAIMDSAYSEGQGTMSKQDGTIQRLHQLALITPVTLTQTTASFVTYVPPNHDQSEIFVIDRLAGSTFGELTKGDVIDESFNHQYATMDQRYVIGVGDGSKDTFPFDIKDLSANASAMPVRKGYVRVFHDKNNVAQDWQKDGLVTGSFKNADGDMVTVSCPAAINYAEGKGSIKFSIPPKAGLEIMIGLDIDIEAAPQLIPLIDHSMRSFVLKPHESAITATNTIQAAFAANREYGIDYRTMQLGAARNVLAAEKDRKRLRDWWFFAKRHAEWPRLPKESITKSQHYEDLSEFLNGLSAAMLRDNKKSGITGIFLGVNACNLVSSLRGGAFVFRPGYRMIAQPHYVGMLLGRFPIYCDPAADPWAGLAVAKGQSYGDSGYVAADAISAVHYPHPILSPRSGGGLTHNDTLYELAYRDIHPHKGRDYFATFMFTNEQGQ